MNAPVALFVYNRPHHTRLTIDALKLNHGAATTPLYIFSDGFKGADDEKAVREVRQFCEDIQGFATVKLINRPLNMGLANNIIDGVSQVISTHGRIIVLEDDLVTSVGFLDYMNHALDAYDQKGVFSICGYTPPVSLPDDYNHSTYLMPRIGSWGWATWAEMWNLADWSVRDFDAFIHDRKQRMLFNQAGNDLTMMLLKQQMGLIRSWAVRFTYSAFKLGYPTVYPIHSLVKNAGVDGSGTHMKKTSKYDSKTTDSIDPTRFCPVINVDPVILSSFKHFYNTSLYRQLINFIKLRYYLISGKLLH